MLALAHSHLPGLHIAQSKHFRLLTCLSLPMFLLAKETLKSPRFFASSDKMFRRTLGTATFATYKTVIYNLLKV